MGCRLRIVICVQSVLWIEVLFDYFCDFSEFLDDEHSGFGGDLDLWDLFAKQDVRIDQLGIVD